MWKIKYHNQNSQFYHSYDYLENTAVDREEFIIELCKERRVLHFGFLDLPFLEEKLREEALLHQKIYKNAKYLFGIDIDKTGIKKYRDITDDYNNALYDIGENQNTEDYLKLNYEIILFPEVLEHIPNPGNALLRLHKICLQNAGCKLCITVPNAYSIIGFKNAIYGIDNVHPDHFFYFSPTTITKLITWAGFKISNIFLYSGYGLLHSPGLSKHGIILICEE